MRNEREQDGRQVIHVIRKGPRQEIRVSLSRFKGREFADLRLFVPNERGEWVPTIKGCTVGLDQIGDLAEAVAKLRRTVGQTAQPA